MRLIWETLVLVITIFCKHWFVISYLNPHVFKILALGQREYILFCVLLWWPGHWICLYQIFYHTICRVATTSTSQWYKKYRYLLYKLYLEYLICISFTILYKEVIICAGSGYMLDIKIFLYPQIKNFSVLQ